MFLDKLKIGSRLMLIVAGTIIGILAVGSYSLVEISQNLLEDRKVKTEHVVDVVTTLVAHYQGQEASGVMTREEAQKAAIASIEKLRYDENEYFWIQSYDNVIVMHPIKPALNGKNMNGTVGPDGVKLFDEFVNVATEKGSGFVEYTWPKPGHDQPVPKISFVKAFAPWKWIVGSGIYVDDVDTIFRRVFGED